MGVKSGGFLYTSYKTRCAEIAKFWMPSILTNARDCDKIMANTAKTAEKDKKRKGKEKDKLAERRMLSKALVLSDRFSSLTAKEQMLYVYLSLEADDDGFLGNTKIFMRIVGCTQKNLDRLAELGYIIKFPSGIVAITHWRMNNAIRSDRYTPTVYLRERAMLTCSKGGVYSLIEGGAEDSPAVDATDTDGIPNGCAPATDADTQVRLGKDSIGKDSIGKDSIGEDSIGKDSETTTTTTDTATTEKNNRLFYNARVRDGSEEYPDFLRRVIDHFEENGYFSSPIAFIKYNESRDWLGVAGEDIKADLDHYAWEWEKNERRLKNISPEASRNT